MGYACPVCGDPQADGEHLANHLAFTALLGDADHEAWLADHAPDWERLDPPGLAERVVDLVPETASPEHFEDTTDHGRVGPDERDAPDHRGPVRIEGDLDAETRAVLDRARELTRGEKSETE